MIVVQEAGSGPWIAPCSSCLALVSSIQGGQGCNIAQLARVMMVYLSLILHIEVSPAVVP